MALKLGTEDKKKVAIVAVLVVVLAVLAVRTILQFTGAPENPAAAPAPVVATPTTSAASTTHSATRIAANAPNSLGLDLDPSLHPELMAAAEGLVYTGSGRNIFSLTSAPNIEKPKAPARPNAVAAAEAAKAAAVPTGPPPPPPIELKYFGYTSTRRGLHKAYLLHDDDIFVAVEGDVVNRRYKIGKIMPTTVVVTDLPFSNTQTLHILPN
jgi:hypothetical protein